MIHFDREHIQAILPQRAPIVMVDEVWAEDADHARTLLSIRNDNFFLHDSLLLEAGIIEHIAQSAAAMVGTRSIGEEAHLGYIGELRNIHIERLPHIGETLLTEVAVIAEASGISLVEASVTAGEDRIAGGQMKVFIEEND